MAAVLIFWAATDRCRCCGALGHGGQRHQYAVCRAGSEAQVERALADKCDVGFDCGHSVEVPHGAMESDLLRAGWTKRGRALICPDHSAEEA
jgi:hypothetical protein